VGSDDDGLIRGNGSLAVESLLANDVSFEFEWFTLNGTKCVSLESWLKNFSCVEVLHG